MQTIRRIGVAAVAMLALTGIGPASSLAARTASPDELAQFAAASESQPDCLDAQISTVDASWAAVRYPSRNDCDEYDYGQLDTYRLTDEGWHLDGVTSDDDYCPSDQAPPAVAADLRLCRTPRPSDYVLGLDDWAGYNGQGWGRRRPRTVYNGGAPSGLIKRISWRHWGHQVATGRGITFLYKPQGGYYDKPGRIRLRADHRQICGAEPTYARLRVSVELRPGSNRYSRWRNWSAASDLCDGNFWG